MAEGNFVDYYKLLGVSTAADSAQIRAAFIKLAKQHHPDVGGSTEQMQLLTRAYRTLIVTSKRKAYDLLHEMEIGETKAHYRDYGTHEGNSLEDLEDDDIDAFLDTVYQEYRAEQAAKQKPTLAKRWRDFFAA